MTSNTTRAESEFSIFSRFSRAFSHVVRGDLSVITNEVSYLATKMPCEELGRVRNRCSQIASIISKIAGLQSDLSLSLVGADAVARTFGAIMKIASTDVVAIDAVKVERLASAIRQMLPNGDVAWTAQPFEEGLALSIELPSHSGLCGAYSSWSGFASKELGERSVVDAVVADLIMRAHGWTIAIDSKDGLRCVMRLPLASAEQRELRCA